MSLEWIPAADEDARHCRDRGGDDRGEARDEDVGPVARDDHERPVDQVVDEVLDAHRGDADVAHLAAQRLTGAGRIFASSASATSADRRERELRQLRENVDRLFAVLR